MESSPRAINGSGRLILTFPDEKATSREWEKVWTLLLFTVGRLGALHRWLHRSRLTNWSAGIVVCLSERFCEAQAYIYPASMLSRFDQWNTHHRPPQPSFCHHVFLQSSHCLTAVLKAQRILPTQQVSTPE